MNTAQLAMCIASRSSHIKSSNCAHGIFCIFRKFEIYRAEYGGQYSGEKNG